MSYTTTFGIDDGDVAGTRLWDVACEVVNIDPNTGVATFTITPRGGKARLPAIYDGTPGLPPVFDPGHISVTVVSPGQTVPPPDVTLLTPGGAGTASTYGLTFYVPKGDTGDPDTTFLNATDVVGVPSAGWTTIYTTDRGLAVGGAATGQPGLVWVPPQVGGIFTATTIASTTGAASPRTLTSISIPGQLRPYRLKASAFMVIGNAPDTKVDLMVTIGSATGDQIAYGPGILGSSTFPVQVGFAGWGAALTSTSGGQYGAGFGVIPAGQATTAFLVAKQLASTGSNWTTPALGPNAAFSVEVSPIP